MTILDISKQLSNFVVYKILPLVTIIVIVIFFFNWKKLHENQKIHLQKDNPIKAHGIILGKKGNKVLYSPTNDEGHFAVFGGSGLGKTSAILIPTLQSWTGTSLTIDISGDICKNVDMPNKLIYAPSNPRSIPYNIFAPIDSLTDTDDKNEALEQLAFLLMPDNEKMADAAQFFNTEGRKILTASLIAFYHTNLDFVSICEKIVGSSWKELFNAIDSTKNQKAIQYINSFAGTSEQNTAGCKQATDSICKFFAINAKVKLTIRRPYNSEIAFSPAMLEQHNVFVVVDDSKLKLYAPLLHIIAAQSMEYFANRPNNSQSTILFCLDEFASLGKMEITDALRKLRKKHVRIMMLTQSMADIDLIYGHDERMAMLNNFAYKIILGASDADTQDYFAKLIGYKTIERKSVSRNSKSTTHTSSESEGFAVSPAELAHLGNDLILLHPNGFIRLKKNFYFL